MPSPSRCLLLSAFGVAGLCGPLVACSGVRHAPPAPARGLQVLPVKPALAAPGPRLFPPTRGPGTVEAGFLHDGSRRLLSFGMRVVEHADGTLEVGDELLPAARSAKFLELPARLGGGFLFSIVSSSVTLLYRSASWAGTLKPVAQLDFEVERLVPGFDRLLLLPRRESDYRALDLESGEPLPAIGLPAAPAYGGMAFADGWFGAVQVPLRGTLVSFDAGASWHPLEMPVTRFEALGGSLSLTTPTATYLLSPRGALSHVADRDASQQSEAVQSELARVLGAVAERPLRPARAMLETAALFGFPDGRGGAFVAAGGTLSRVALDTGRVLESRRGAYPGATECQGVRLGQAGVGFVCGQGQELTRIYRAVAPLGLELVAEFPGARVVGDSGSGSLVVRGTCSGPNKGLSYCVVPGSGAAHQLTVESERDRVVALADGRVAVLTPPALGKPGALRLLSRSAPAQRIKLSAASGEPRHKLLLEQGLWLDGMIESRPGLLSGWVVGAGPFAGVQVDLSGKLSLRRVEEHASRALFAGKRALVLGTSGLASETTDGGSQWLGVELPPDIDLKALAGSGFHQGCSAIGCAFAGFTRIGFFDGRAAERLAAPPTPARVQFPSPGGGRWVLHCEPTSEESAPSLPLRPASALRGRRSAAIPGAVPDEPELPPLSPLLDAAPPPLGENMLGVDAGTEPHGVQTRLYVVGPRGTDWTRTGSLRIAFADRYSVKPSVHVTANARSPWPDATSAADALGAEPSTSAVGMAAALDHAGNAGGLLLNSRGTLDLFLFEAGGVPIRIANVGKQGMASRLSGVVKARGGFYVGSYDDNTKAFRVYHAVGQLLELVLEVADIPAARGGNAELVRSVSGDALAIWVRGTGWFVHPIDMETLAVEAPYVVTPPELAALPRLCEPAAEGFVVSGVVAPDPYAELSGGLSARAFEGRFRVSALGVCVDELAAQGERTATATATSSGLARATVSVTLSERKPLGRRLGLRCSN